MQKTQKMMTWIITSSPFQMISAEQSNSEIVVISTYDNPSPNHELWNFCWWLVIFKISARTRGIPHQGMEIVRNGTCLPWCLRRRTVDDFPSKDGKKWYLGVSGRICLCAACYDFMLLFNVCSLVLMIYWDIVRGRWFRVLTVTSLFGLRWGG